MYVTEVESYNAGMQARRGRGGLDWCRQEKPTSGNQVTRYMEGGSCNMAGRDGDLDHYVKEIEGVARVGIPVPQRQSVRLK